MKNQREPDEFVDMLIGVLDKGFKTLSGNVTSSRPNPAQEVQNNEMTEKERSHAAGLMRVNYVGEICAQALYEGQALTAKNESVKEQLLQAADEERDHLAWCAERLQELNSHRSLLSPFFYVSSFCMGAVTGLLGDKHSLGFVEATEDRVVAHIDEHLDTLPEADKRSRAVLTQMREDEKRHGEEALSIGGEQFSEPAKGLMKILSGVMTRSTYRF